MTYLELALHELEQWQRRINKFLYSRGVDESAIEALIEQHEADPRSFHEQVETEGVSKSLAHAIGALSIFRSLKKLVGPLTLPVSENETIPVQMAARLALLSFHAGINVGISGPELRIEENSALVEAARPLVHVSRGGSREKAGRNTHPCTPLVSPVALFLAVQQGKFPSTKGVQAEIESRISGIAAKNPDCYDDIDRLIVENNIAGPTPAEGTIKNLIKPLRTAFKEKSIK